MAKKAAERQMFSIYDLNDHRVRFFCDSLADAERLVAERKLARYEIRQDGKSPKLIRRVPAGGR